MHREDIIEKIMYWWAKLGSFILVYLLIQVLYALFLMVKLYFKNQVMSEAFSILGLDFTNFFTFGDVIWMTFGLITGVFSAFYLFLPFLYYGWVQNEDDKNVKIHARIVSVFWSIFLILFIFAAIKEGVNDLSQALYLILTAVFIVPLYYFAWRK